MDSNEELIALSVFESADLVVFVVAVVFGDVDAALVVFVYRRRCGCK